MLLNPSSYILIHCETESHLLPKIKSQQVQIMYLKINESDWFKVIPWIDIYFFWVWESHAFQLPKAHSLSYLRPNIQQQMATMTYH